MKTPDEIIKAFRLNSLEARAARIAFDDASSKVRELIKRKEALHGYGYQSRTGRQTDVQA